MIRMFFFLFGSVYILCEILYPSNEVYSFYYRKNFLRFVQQSFIYIYIYIMGQFVKILHYFILAFLIFKRIPYGLVITDLFFISVSHVILVGNNVTVP